MAVQQAAVDVFNFIEEWWGERLSPELILRMAAAPAAHLREFAHDWPKTDAFRTLEVLRPGEIRPIYGDSYDWDFAVATVAPRLLLYTDTVVENVHNLQPFWRYDDEEDFSWDGVGQDVLRSFEWMRQMRPLVEDGAIVFLEKSQAMVQANEMDLGFADVLESVGVPHSSRLLFDNQMSGNILAARAEVATPLALSEAENVEYRRLLSGIPSKDKRVTHLTALAMLPVPDFQGDIATLVRARKASDAFAEFRNALKSALALVEEVPDGAEATGIIGSELRTSLARVENEVNRSPALSALRTGLKGLAFTGLGAGAGGLITQSPAGALVGGSVSKIADVVSAYVDAIAERRNTRAVWSVVMSFSDADR